MPLGLGKCFGIKHKRSKSQNMVPHIKLEIGNKEGKKWISENRSLHDSIFVELNPESSELWRVERHASKPSWSFHVLSSINQKKIYVTYNDENNDVTLEYEDDVTSDEEKGRYFTLLLQPTHGMFLRAEGVHDRYLYSDGGKLKMFTGTPTNEMIWLITPSFELIQTIVESHECQIQPVSSSQKWISDGAAENGSIQVQQTSQEEKWLASGTCSSDLTFSVGDLYANASMQFGKQPVYFTYSPDGWTLQCNSNTQYVTAPADNGDLYLVSEKSQATGWEFPTLTLIFEYLDKTLIFPEYPIKDKIHVK